MIYDLQWSEKYSILIKAEIFHKFIMCIYILLEIGFKNNKQKLFTYTTEKLLQQVLVNKAKSLLK